jgi:hypothetical protein
VLAAIRTSGQADESIAPMGLTPITASRLTCQQEQRGKALTVLDPDGNALVRGLLGMAAKPAYAVFEAAEGRWHIEQADRRRFAVVDSGGNVVATARSGEVALANGETLPWEWSRHGDRYLLGDLCVSEARGRSNRGFTVELSEEMLSRQDRGLITGIASVLTQDRLRHRRRWAVLRYLGP